MGEYYGRSAGADGSPQTLSEHLRAVAATAETFAREAGLPEGLGQWAGILHDLGKYSPEFQRKLLNQNRDQVVHSYQGAALAWETRAIECAFAIAAHHTGLKDKSSLRDVLDGFEGTLGLSNVPVLDRARQFAALAEAESLFTSRPPATIAGRGEELKVELRTRILLSCLADADRLDAEKWGDPEKAGQRSGPALDPARRLETVLRHIGRIASEHGDSAPELLDARSHVLEAALAAAVNRPGFFSLTVPTGGGKTLSSLGFALRHAATHGMRRIIFVVPFLTIIEQNADAIRAALGDRDGDSVLEHHSNAVQARKDDDDSWTGPALRQRLLAENWDSPVILTSAVQFFESLFSDHPTQLRKIHNIAGSVIVFDEAQTFPPELLRPLTGMLQQLVEEYGCSALFCTATQPALSAPIRGRDDQALLTPGSIREIMPEPDRLFDRLRRVQVEWRTDQPTSMDAVAAEMLGERAALAVVNTKRDARQLYEALVAQGPGEPFHLSTRMCPEHRRVVLNAIRDRLRRGEPCYVASTQLVEAGVDLDFPAVWRAMGPLDSIAQAAGRCNREGRLPEGRVTVFQTEDGRMPGGAYRLGANVAASMLAQGAADLGAPGTFTNYFVRLYNAKDLDQHGIVALRKSLDFPEVAKQFRLIGDDSTPAIVPFGEGARWAERALAKERLTRSDLRQTQRYMVALYSHELSRAIATGDVVQTEDGLHVFAGQYDERLGLVLTNDPLEN